MKCLLKYLNPKFQCYIDKAFPTTHSFTVDLQGQKQFLKVKRNYRFEPDYNNDEGFAAQINKLLCAHYTNASVDKVVKKPMPGD